MNYWEFSCLFPSRPLRLAEKSFSSCPRALALPVIVAVGLTVAFQGGVAGAQEPTDEYFFGYPTVSGELGERIDLAEWATSVDSSLCADDRYSEADDDVVDALNNNFSFVGGQILVRSRTSGGQDWQNVKSIAITEEMVDVECYGDPSGEDGPGKIYLRPGESADDVNWLIPTPASRTEFDSSATSPGGLTVATRPSELVPEYGLSTQWSCPGQTGCPDQVRKKIGLARSGLRKGTDAGLWLEGDSRLAGMKVTVLMGKAGKDGIAVTYRAVTSTRFKLSGRKARAILRWMVPSSMRKRWTANKCIDFSPKAPELGPRNACPSGTVSGVQARESFFLNSVSE